jgi:photosystem II stability/assembly factor-like uncharacterized protein
MMRRVLLLLFSVSFLYGRSQAWQQAAGPAGGYVFSLATSGNMLYATSHAGVFASADNGTTWNEINDGLPQTYYSISLAADGANLVLATAYGVYYSHDAGASWHVSVNTPSQMFVTKIGNCFFAGGYYGLYKSWDNGTTWLNSTSGIPQPQHYDNNPIRSLHQFGNRLLAGTGDGIYSADTSAGAWNLLTSQLADVWSFAHIGQQLFAGTHFGIYTSLDSGKHWSSVNANIGNNHINWLLARDSLLFAATAGGVFITSDKGLSWQAMNAGIGESAVQSLAECGGVLIAATGDLNSSPAGYSPTHTIGNLYRSTDGGLTWACVSGRLPNLSTQALVRVNNLLIAGTVRGVLISADEGQTWLPRNNGLNNIQVQALYYDPPTLYAGTAGGGVYTSVDTGHTWTYSSVTFFNKNVMHFARQGQYVLAGTGLGVYATLNGGASWIKIDSSWIGGYPTTSLTVLGDYVYQGVNDGMYLYRYTGSGWEFKENLFKQLRWSVSLVTHAGKVYTARTDGIFMTADTGKTWIQKDNGVNGAPYKLISEGGVMYAGTANGVYYTTDDGDNWLPLEFGISEMEVYSLCTSSQKLYVATNGGVWMNNLPLTSVHETTDATKHEIYPNPASDYLFLPLHTAADGVTILNSVGETALELSTAPDRLNIEFLPSGIYFVRIGASVRKFIKL